MGMSSSLITIQYIIKHIYKNYSFTPQGNRAPIITIIKKSIIVVYVITSIIRTYKSILYLESSIKNRDCCVGMSLLLVCIIIFLKVYKNGGVVNQSTRYQFLYKFKLIKINVIPSHRSTHSSYNASKRVCDVIQKHLSFIHRWQKNSTVLTADRVTDKTEFYP